MFLLAFLRGNKLFLVRILSGSSEVKYCHLFLSEFQINSAPTDKRNLVGNTLVLAQQMKPNKTTIGPFNFSGIITATPHTQCLRTESSISRQLYNFLVVFRIRFVCRCFGLLQRFRRFWTVWKKLFKIQFLLWTRPKLLRSKIF